MATSKTNEKSSVSDEYIKDLSECPVCIEAIRSAPIHQCTNGHVICKDCILKLDSCPICRSDSTLARNLMLEQIISKIYGPQQVKEGPYEKSKFEEWGHFLNEEPTIQLNLTSNSQHSSEDLEIIEAATPHVDRKRIILKCIRSVFKFIGTHVGMPRGNRGSRSPRSPAVLHPPSLRVLEFSSPRPIPRCPTNPRAPREGTFSYFFTSPDFTSPDFTSPDFTLIYT